MSKNNITTNTTTTDDDDEDKEHPLNCYSRIGDGYSGWYAISNPHKCTDFCFWNPIQTSTSSSSSSSSQAPLSKNNTANPHETTILSDRSIWTCLMNVSGDDITWSSAVNDSKRRIDPYNGTKGDDGVTEMLSYYGTTFDYLRCNNGAKESVDVKSEGMIRSRSFWWGLIVMSLICLASSGFDCYRRWRRSKSRRQSSCTNNGDTIVEMVDILNETDDEEETDDQYDTPITLTSHGAMHRSLGVMVATTFRKFTSMVIILVINIFALLIIILSTISLMELYGKFPSSTMFMSLTPFCIDPDVICPIANADFSRFSDVPPISPKPDISDDVAGFSYAVASDAQMNWYDGESAYLGKQIVPPTCTSTDSCYACTMKVARHTNEQFKRALERVSTDDDDNDDDDGQFLPPRTLIMNGDLTAYFHPNERTAYESIYHSLPPSITSYFPSLGNHDYAHPFPAHYGLDEWLPSPTAHYCNALHAIAYLKSGFCHRIPRFDPHRIVNYDAQSLAYSWNEGSYHFVHVHFHPGWESRSIGVRSSVAWLKGDLAEASERGYVVILFVHDAGGLTRDLEDVLLEGGVKAIFAGHYHRCFMRKCVGLRALRETEVTGSDGRFSAAERCIPGTMAQCGGYTGRGDQSLYHVDYLLEEGLEIPSTKLFNEIHRRHKKNDRCPKPSKMYVNETDNTLLCVKATYVPADFPFADVDDDDDDEIYKTSQDDNTTIDGKIPIFWSGSVSFQTFLHVQFYHDRFVVNAMTAMDGVEGQRYVDVNDVPNAVYPYHDQDDFKEVTIYV